MAPDHPVVPLRRPDGIVISDGETVFGTITWSGKVFEVVTDGGTSRPRTVDAVAKLFGKMGLPLDAKSLASVGELQTASK